MNVLVLTSEPISAAQLRDALVGVRDPELQAVLVQCRATTITWVSWAGSSQIAG